MKKIILLNPPLCENVMKAKYKALAPPLGLLYIAAVLLKNGFDVQFIDGDKEQSTDVIFKKITVYHPDMIGITTSTMAFENAISIAEKAKKLLPDAFLFMGGQHATFYAEKILKNYKFIDAVCRGEGENTVLQLMEGMTFSSINGLTYRKDSAIVSNPDRKLIDNLDELPFPARHLASCYKYSTDFCFIDLRKYLYSKMSNYVSIITSRGCPGGCYFCSGTQYNGRKIRFRSPENVIAEIDMLLAQGYENFFIPDDNFTAWPERVKKICTYLKERRKFRNISWFCFGRVDAASEELYREMRAAGCFFILFGIEHISPKIRDYFHKNTTNEQIVNAIHLAKKCGINVYASVIVGSPVEDETDFRQCVEFFKKSEANIIEAHRLMIFPGSELWQDTMRKNPELIDRFWKEPLSYTQVSAIPSLKTVTARQKILTRAFYFRAGFLSNTLKSVLTDSRETRRKLEVPLE